ncbi:MAG: hypothetical protein ABI718_12480 [Acidobacteriota bacterium]
MNVAELLSLSPSLVNALWIIGVLVIILLTSFALRAKVFCQYLNQMTGIVLSPAEVKDAFRRRGRDGVRELLLDRTIRADLEDNPSLIPPETE